MVATGSTCLDVGRAFTRTGTMGDTPPGVTPHRYAENLRKITRLSRGIVQQAVEELAPPVGSVGLDLGCGIGVDSLLLGAAVGGSGRVIGVDPSTAMLDEARSGAERSGLGDVLDYHQGTIDRLPLPDASVDWIWCKDVFWPAPGVVDDPPAALGELCRVVRPGGTIALLYWTSQSVLSGYPVLEALLGARVADTLPYLAGVPAERHFLRAAGWMRQAGLVDVRTRALSAGHQGPLDSTTQEAMGCLFDMFYGGMESSISREDWALLRTLTDPESPDYLPRREDYYCVLNYTLFMGLAVA